MNTITIINPFNSGNSKIANIKALHRLIMMTITDRILKFKPIMKKTTLANPIFFTVIILISISYFVLNQFYCNVTFIRTNLSKTNLYQFQKDCYQDNLSFACLQFYIQNYLNILARNI